MRNVHLITKEQEGADVLHQYLYITSNEKIKQGDWCIYDSGEVIQYLVKLNTDNLKKIILTDNPDLIAEGVQPIDNEFLEWFVKNPSCERVEVENEWEGNGTMFGFKMGNASTDGTWRYQIIIPQEEPKQIKCYCGHTITCDCEPLQETLEEPTEEAKQRAEIYMSLKGALEPLQETLEEAKLKFCNDSNNWQGSSREDLKLGWDACAKLQAERMYSEEDMISFAKFFTQYTFIDNTSVGDLYALDETGNHPAYKIAELISIFKKK
jgi:hypothetical protein